MKNLGMVSWWLMVAGAINWGLVGAFNYNLVSVLFGGFGLLESIIYIVIGLAGVYALAKHFEMV